ncbi:hypothetical protein [Pseudoxanthomonas sp. USHLN014]|uniref:hypothetical protein n=1 Tax=Pseudoxanthomonas sp. USHLN014 TaxID=3081297 RepID=UPI00301B7F2A
MTAPVAVLALIDREIARAGGHYYSDGRDLIAARAAMAELIKIGREVEQADSDGTTTDELMDRFRAALARVGATP